LFLPPSLSNNLFEKGLIKNPSHGVITSLFPKGLTATLLEKGLTENLNNVWI